MNQTQEMYFSEVRILLDDLETFYLRRNRIEDGSCISEVRERFEIVMEQDADYIAALEGELAAAVKSYQEQCEDNNELKDELAATKMKWEKK